MRIDGTDYSYVDVEDPMYLEFDYVQRIVHVVDTCFEPGERITAVHVGGAGMTLPRYIAHTRPTSGQIVLEPDTSLTQAVRDTIPLPPCSGIKVRPVDGRAGILDLADDYADLVIVDAFANAQVPADLATREWFAEVRRVVRPSGVMVMNFTGHAPFDYARRLIAAISASFGPVVIGAEPSTWKGRRFGNFVIATGPRVDPYLLERAGAGAPFPYRLLHGTELDRWVGPAQPFTDADTRGSPPPPGGPTVFR